RCGHNLFGQPIVRERHYGLIIARCPECGTVSPLQEYPTLGPWATRIGMILTGLWLLLVVAAAVASAGALTAMSGAAGEWLSRDVPFGAMAEFERWLTQTGQTNPSLSSWQARLGPEGLQWWADRGGVAGYVDSCGGWLSVVNWKSVLFWIPMGLGAV